MAKLLLLFSAACQVGGMYAANVNDEKIEALKIFWYKLWNGIIN